MDIFQISYLLRYVLLALILLIVWNLLSLSVSELRFTFKNCATPTKGYFLMSVPSERDSGAGSFLPLYHTTYIGSGRSSDIRVKSRLIFKRHAIIYFFDNAWYIRSAAKNTPVYVNHFEILHPIPLENMDEIGLGEYSFTFVDERKSASDAKLPYEDYVPDPEYPKNKARPRLFASYLGINASLFLGFTMLYFFVPSSNPDIRKTIAISSVVFLLFTNVLYWVLPIVFRNIDKVLLQILLFLSGIGLILQTRLSVLPAERLADFPSGLITQAASLAVGLFLLPICIFFAARTLLPEYLSKLCMVLTPLLLLSTLIFGNGADSHGATLWISIGGISLQLTEFAKITYLIVLADFFKNRATKKHQMIFALWASACFLLILLLPDLGSAMILLPTTLIVYVVMTSEYLTTALILAAGSGLSVIAFTLFPHVQRRIVGWTSLWTEVNDNNRQIVYGLQAMARGGLLGRGLGNGSPGGIPLASSDMIFSIFCEEFGLIVGLSLVVLFILVWLRSSKTAIRSHDGFSSGLSLGIGTLLFVEAAIVISGVTGLVPLTGATLPLIARGGSSVLTIVVLFSLLIGLSCRKPIGGKPS